MDEIYLIWSHEHSAWWKPGKWGYTGNPVLAGRYTRDDAIAICIHALPGSAERLGALPELPVRLADLQEMLQNYPYDHPFGKLGATT